MQPSEFVFFILRLIVKNASFSSHWIWLSFGIKWEMQHHFEQILNTTDEKRSRIDANRFPKPIHCYYLIFVFMLIVFYHFVYDDTILASISFGLVIYTRIQYRKQLMGGFGWRCVCECVCSSLFARMLRRHFCVCLSIKIENRALYQTIEEVFLLYPIYTLRFHKK